jgi:sulfatase maturation enzyme AslB (radical SAM superfamily)
MDKHNLKHFCILPFVHRHIDSAGFARVCCASNVRPTKELDYELAQNILKQDKPLAECEMCYERERNGISSYRIQMNEFFNDDVNRVFNGEKPEFSFFDIRDNLCNMTCRSCVGSSSTSLLKIEKAIGTELKILTPFYASKTLDIRKEEFREAVKNRKLKRVYWAGGEPLMSPFHWEIMKLMKEYSVMDTLISYNTNLSILKFKDIYAPSFLGEFDFLRMIISVDGIGKTYEYSRPSFKFELIKNNILEYSKHLRPDSLNMSTVTTIPVMFDLKPLIEFSETYFPNRDIFLHIFSETGKNLLNPKFLPRTMLEDLCNKNVEFLNTFGDKYSQAIEVFKYYLSADEQVDVELLKTIKTNTEKFDKYIGVSTSDFYSSIDTDLGKWYNSI